MSASIEKIRAARDLIAKGWTKYTMAVSTRGRKVLPTDPDATAWCLRGAMYKATCGDAEKQFVAKLIDPYLHEGVDFTLMSFNDDRNRTQADVVALLDRAIDIQTENTNA